MIGRHSCEHGVVSAEIELRQWFLPFSGKVWEASIEMKASIIQYFLTLMQRDPTREGIKSPNNSMVKIYIKDTV